MSSGADAQPEPDADPFDRLRHDLKTPLTIASARAQLLRRQVLRSSSLTELERSAMLDGLAAIEAAVRAMVPVVDGICRDPAEPGG
jgi:signal transduction histidine kinase